jgi:hypothetical protein
MFNFWEVVAEKWSEEVVKPTIKEMNYQKALNSVKKFIGQEGRSVVCICEETEVKLHELYESLIDDIEMTSISRGEAMAGAVSMGFDPYDIDQSRYSTLTSELTLDVISDIWKGSPKVAEELRQRLWEQQQNEDPFEDLPF